MIDIKIDYEKNKKPKINLVGNTKTILNEVSEVVATTLDVILSSGCIKTKQDAFVFLDDLLNDFKDFYSKQIAFSNYLKD